MRNSIKKQLVCSFMILTCVLILALLFINVFFLEYYYLESKKQNLLDTYLFLDDWSREETIDTHDFDAEMQRICSIYNISFIVTDPSANIVKTSINNYEEFNQQLRDIIFSRSESNPEILETENSYAISNISDASDGMEYLVMWGSLENGNFFMLRTALEGIRNSAALANIFLIYVGCGVVIVAAIVIVWISRKISTPIMELATISEKMADLDFEAKYTGHNNNELDILGSNFNQMSERLEETIKNLKAANLELQKDVEDKTRIDNMRKEFLANVSHELKTPIALIQGYAEGLKEGVIQDRDSLEFYCDVIMDETKKMNRMVKQLMTLNQLEFGTEIPQVERFDITELMNTCIQSAEILTRQAGITVYFYPKEPCYVWGDVYKVEEVFTNYFNNAINHASGEKVIRITLEKRDNNIVRAGVFNTGARIPEEALPHLWEKFYKVDKARTREYGGSGIGLSIVKAVMESLHGDYGVVNRENGVEFWFELSAK